MSRKSIEVGYELAELIKERRRPLKLTIEEESKNWSRDKNLEQH